MSYSLVVVDIQAQFKAATKPHVRLNAIREITLAMERQAGILFLEFNMFGETLPDVVAPVMQARYKRSITAIKDERDGSVFVRKAVQDRAFYSEWFRVVGVNTDQCVLETVRGIRAWFPQARIEVVADACESDWNHQAGLMEIKKLNNVSIVNEV